MTTGVDRLYEELSFLAFHLHWPLDDLLDLESPVRVRFLREVQRLVDAGR